MQVLAKYGDGDEISALTPARPGDGVPFGAFAEAVSKAPTVRPRVHGGLLQDYCCIPHNFRFALKCLYLEIRGASEQAHVVMSRWRLRIGVAAAIAIRSRTSRTCRSESTKMLLQEAT